MWLDDPTLSRKSFVLAILLVTVLAKPQDLSENTTNESVQNSEAKCQKQDSSDEFCLTPGCVHAASKLLITMDKSVDPCDDFYGFVCGRYIKETIIPDDKSEKAHFFDLSIELSERMKLIFEAEDATKDNSSIYSGVRNFYKSCMDENQIEENSKEDAENILEQLGGWPVVLGEQWSGEDFSWKSTIEKAGGLGLDQNVIINLGIKPDQSDATKRLITIDQPSFGLSREYLIEGPEDKTVQAYFKYMVDMAVYMGADEEIAEKEMKKVLQFEIDLANMALPKEERRNETALYNSMTISKAEELFGEGFDLTSHINMLFENIVPKKSVQVESDEIINVAVPGYINNFTNYIAGVDSRVQANYMMWRYMKEIVSYMDNTVQGIKLDFDKVKSGKKRQSPRWQDCAKAVSGTSSENYIFIKDGSLANVVGSMYVKVHFPLSTKKIADDMVANIRKEFKIILNEITWMDEKTRERALNKADEMGQIIGYPEQLLDDSLIEQFYEELDLSSPSYMLNYLAMKKFLNGYNIRNYREPLDRKAWETHGGTAVVNAFYMPEKNVIVMPAGILNGYFFQGDRPQYMNYGAVGMVIGHEITHGFDDQGSQYDEQGNLVNWWEPATQKSYIEKGKCMIDQYAAINVTIAYDNGEEVEYFNLNGINTQGENVADHGGLKEALRAYRRREKEVGKEPLLPGLNYNQNQLFWMSYASQLCQKLRPAKLKETILTDRHAPQRYRTNVALSNLPQFAADFSCPKGSAMNPAKRCEVW